jgi:hypothetical protein
VEQNPNIGVYPWLSPEIAGSREVIISSAAGSKDCNMCAQQNGWRDYMEDFTYDATSYDQYRNRSDNVSDNICSSPGRPDAGAANHADHIGGDHRPRSVS